MKTLLTALIITLTLTLQAKEKESDCIKALNQCRAECYANPDPTGECILKCYKKADEC